MCSQAIGNRCGRKGKTDQVDGRGEGGGRVAWHRLQRLFSAGDRARGSARAGKAAAEKLGYGGPDPKGRLLRAGKVNAIGVATAEPLAYFFDDPFARVVMSASARPATARAPASRWFPPPTTAARLEHQKRAGRRFHRLLPGERLAACRSHPRARPALRRARLQLR